MNNLDFWAEIQDISWVSVLNNTINLGSHYKVVPTEGYLAWEYNPLRNYRLSENMYEKDGKYYSEADVKTALKAICNKDVIFYYTEDIIHRINEIIANF